MRNKIFKILINLILMIALTTQIANAEGETAPTQTSAQQQYPCDIKPEDIKEGVVYVELNEALGNTKCIKGANGVDFIKNYIYQIYVYAAGLVGIVAVFSIVAGGIQLIVRGEEDNSEVKERITKSFVGIAILFLSALILYTINPTFYVLK